MALRHVILTALHRGPATGYAIVKDFDDALGFFWSATHQQVYRDLGQLAAEGLVRFTTVDQDGRPDRKVYELTDAGRRALGEWAAAPLEPQRVRDELLVKLLAGGLVAPETLPALLAAQRARHEAALATYRALEREHFGGAPVHELPVEARLVYLTLRRGIRSAEAWLAWADEADAVIRTLDGAAPDAATR